MNRQEIEARYGKLLTSHINCKTTVTHKYCKHCQQWKKHKHFHKCAQSAVGLHSKCKQCKHAQNDHRKQTLRKYKLTDLAYAEMLLHQGGVCAICGKGSDRQGWSLNIDHNHSTGKVRGLLCRHCNTALGGFHDNEQLLLKAVDYLRRSDA